VARTDAELKELAKRVITNEVYLAAEKDSIENSFMILLALGANFPKDTVALYEEYSKAMPRAVNGHPTFTSCGYLRKNEFLTFQKYWNEYDELLNR
jgi:hypothetical protein